MVIHKDSQDLQFLCNSTSLSESKLSKLLEEDFALVADALSELDISDAKISFDLFARLTILRETKAHKFELDEKMYVADCLVTHYPNMFKESHYLIDRLPLSERTGQYYLILTGMFPEFLIQKSQKTGAPSLSFYSKLAKQAFSQVDKKKLANNVEEWIELLYYIKSCCWY